MSSFMPDTSCMVPLVSPWHEHHQPATREIDRRLAAGETLTVAAPSLVEAYSVLTRMPQPRRISPTQALTALERNFMGRGVEMVALDVGEYYRLLSEAQDAGIAGGNIYDAVIAACAQKARVDTLLTFNERQFRRLGIPDLNIAVPA